MEHSNGEKGRPVCVSSEQLEPGLTPNSTRKSVLYIVTRTKIRRRDGNHTNHIPPAVPVADGPRGGDAPPSRRRRALLPNADAAGAQWAMAGYLYTHWLAAASLSKKSATADRRMRQPPLGLARSSTRYGLSGPLTR